MAHETLSTQGTHRSGCHFPIGAQSGKRGLSEFEGQNAGSHLSSAKRSKYFRKDLVRAETCSKAKRRQRGGKTLLQAMLQQFLAGALQVRRGLVLAPLGDRDEQNIDQRELGNSRSQRRLKILDLAGGGVQN